MGVLGDVIREIRNNLKGAYEECGGENVVDELKDIIKAIEGK